MAYEFSYSKLKYLIDRKNICITTVYCIQNHKIVDSKVKNYSFLCTSNDRSSIRITFEVIEVHFSNLNLNLNSIKF